MATTLVTVDLCPASWPEVGAHAVASDGLETAYVPLGEGTSALADVAEAPWSGAEWAVAFRFDNPRANVSVLFVCDTPLGVLGFRTP